MMQPTLPLGEVKPTRSVAASGSLVGAGSLFGARVGAVVVAAPVHTAAMSTRCGRRDSRPKRRPC
ncbi:MAG: hypothetical protein JWR34_1088 [Mycobacterium sp.]|nr:hypothetical protein [Mycobacterium sp.]